MVRQPIVDIEYTGLGTIFRTEDNTKIGVKQGGLTIRKRSVAQTVPSTQLYR
jgi:hypothetical protein